MSTCVRYLRPSKFEAGALRAACGHFLAVAGVVPARTRLQAGKRQADWRSLASDAELREITTIEMGARYRIQGTGDSPWSLTLEAWRQRWVVTVTAPSAPLAAAALEAFCAELKVEQANCLALALSGGGFRATLFHLGVVRMLADLGKLQDVTHICSVSGGSILAAHLVQNWHRYTGGDFDAAAREILDFVQRDVRGRVFRRWIMGLALAPVLALLRAGGRWTRTRLLQEEYDRLYRGERLGALGGDRDPRDAVARPDLFILATAMKTGDMCAFTSHGLQFERRYLGTELEETEEQLIDCSLVPISMAVTASSAFPPAFPPVYVTHEQLRVDASRFLQSPEYLSDGGVYDNLGIRKIQHLKARTSFQLAGILVSDAEAPFVWQVGANYQRFWNRAVRSSDILMKRVADLEYEWAMQSSGQSQPPILRAQISQTLTDTAGALAHELVRAIRQIRTDLDRFHGLEISCLVRHGYQVARHALTGSPLLSPAEEQRIQGMATPWQPPVLKPADRATHPMSERGTPDEDRAPETAPLADVQANVERLERIQRGVARWASAVFDARDWASWITVAALLTYVVAAIGSPAAYVYIMGAKERTVLVKEGKAKDEVLRTKEDEIERVTRERDSTKGTLSAEQEKNRPTVEAYKYDDPWAIQFAYLEVAQLDQDVDPTIRELAAKERELPDDALTRASVEAYRRLLKVAGRSSEVCPAYVNWAQVYGKDVGLMRGRVPKFIFPGTGPDQGLLLEFSGQAPGASQLPAEIHLDFFQSKLREPTETDVQPVSQYSIAFVREGNAKDYRGNLLHPLLKDHQGNELPIAIVRLWKEEP